MRPSVAPCWYERQKLGERGVRSSRDENPTTDDLATVGCGQRSNLSTRVGAAGIWGVFCHFCAALGLW
jgi:hypothetical protein